MLRNRFVLLIGSLIPVTVVLNLILVYFEKDAGSGIDNFSHAVWYMVVTLTTVGYGDLYPATTGGKVIGYIYVFASLGVLGFLFSTISNKVYKMLEEKRLGFKNFIHILKWLAVQKVVFFYSSI